MKTRSYEQLQYTSVKILCPSVKIVKPRENSLGTSYDD